MKAVKSPKLNTRLLAVFFLAVFLLAMAEFFVFSHLLRSVEQEEQTINQERLNNAVTKLDMEFEEIRSAYTQIVLEKPFNNTPGPQLTDYQFYEMTVKGKELFDGNRNINGWVVLIQGTDRVVSCGGDLSASAFDGLRKNDTYNMTYWWEMFQTTNGARYYPQAEFLCIGEGSQVGVHKLVPLTMKSPFNKYCMPVLLLDMEEICARSDAYLQEGAYLFWDNELIYTSDESAIIGSIPQTGELTDEDGVRYVVHTGQLGNNMILVKLQPELEATGVLRSNFLVCIIIAVSALAVTAILIPTSVKRVMDPVNRMYGLIHQHSEAKDPGFRFDACQELEVILKNREQQAAALAQRDAVLSEYFLQSKLKNVYVDINTKPQIQEGTAYILYIQVQYQPSCREGISMPRAELESCIQTMLSGTLNNLFETTMVFQLEPGRFAARVTLPVDDGEIDGRMERFMKRLDIEQEFACFTVIRSAALSQADELSEIYAQVQEAARMALVCDRSQLLTLPLPEKKEKEFIFTGQQEKSLMTLVSQQKLPEAVELAREIMEENLKRGISHMQVEILCVALVNTVAQAATRLEESADKIAAASGVYNVITSRCATGGEYVQTVTDFIRTMGSGEQTETENDALLNNVRRYLQENYQKEFSSEDMASALHVSRSYLSTYYKSKTGINLSESIQIFRMQKAVELLQDKDIRTGDVGALVGIPSNNTFLRWFKKYTGMTPNEYRNKLLNQ